MKFKSFVVFQGLMILSSLAIASGLSIQEQQYTIQAASEKDIIQALEAQAPKEDGTGKIIFGWTHFGWGETKINATPREGGCFVKSIEPQAVLTRTTPKLVGGQQNTWVGRFDNFSRAIQQHENKHLLIYESAWRQLEGYFSGFQGKVYQGDCQALQRAVSGKLAMWRSAVQQDQMGLDQREGHFTRENLNEFFGIRSGE